MTDEPISLLCKSGGYSQTLTLHPDRLTISWRRGVESGERSVPISKLSHTLSSATGRPKNTTLRIRLGVFVLGMAAVVYWSVVQEEVPLLAPILACLGIALLAKQVKNLRVRSWTVICLDDGKMFTYIMHDNCDEKERKRFEDAYLSRFGTTLYKKSPGEIPVRPEHRDDERAR